MCGLLTAPFEQARRLLLWRLRSRFEVIEVGAFMPRMSIIAELKIGDVGFVVAGIKNVKDTRVGDTVTDLKNPALEALPGYRRINPMVFCGLYPIDNSEYNDLREALEKLELNDARFVMSRNAPLRLGFGFRCGFLGLLHMEIIQERVEREFNIPLITTAPSVIYHVTLTNGEVLSIDNPANYPEPGQVLNLSKSLMLKRRLLYRMIMSGQLWSFVRANAANSLIWSIWILIV